MTCDVCRALVRQTPGDAEAHRLWHLSLGDLPLRRVTSTNVLLVSDWRARVPAGDLDLDLGRGRRAVVDKCRHCGDLAFQPIQAKQPEALRGRWFARRLWRRQLPMNKNPRRSRQTGRFTSVPTHD
jgi:hypothetical protein